MSSESTQAAEHAEAEPHEEVGVLHEIQIRYHGCATIKLHYVRMYELKVESMTVRVE